MPLGVREERMFKKKYGSYLKTLKELSVERAEEIAALLTVADILSSSRKVDVNLTSPRA
ncbi:MAG: hypothetical protein RMI85_07985 [Candidatus Korarchaeum sp.]|nr:hypothetical protein [Candidatus Korarchaeum sp.]